MKSRLSYALTGLHILFMLLCLGLAAHLKDPHLLPLRVYETPGLLGVALLGLLFTFRAAVAGKVLPAFLALVWMGIGMLTVHGEFISCHEKKTVQEASGDTAMRLRHVGKHLIVGYDRIDDIRELVRQGYIAGVFVTRRNAAGKSFTQLRDEISSLQSLRREAGLPPLIVASDQEGGTVARLTPPLPRQPALSSLLSSGLPKAEIERRAFAYGQQQGQALKALGINVNFSPVTDLKPPQASGPLDFHTRIAERAIAANPDSVTHAALAYSQALRAEGVMPTLKHFPGLGSVNEDTHHFSARLALPLAELNARDWVPFRRVLGQSPAMLMIAHVVVDAVDAELPASLSHKLINGIVRANWKHQGILISDDMTMAASYNRGLCKSSILALNAGLDLLLLAYDWEKVYRVLDCLQRADQAGRLTALDPSQMRLAGLMPTL